jgi:hypothetical protein
MTERARVVAGIAEARAMESPPLFRRKKGRARNSKDALVFRFGFVSATQSLVKLHLRGDIFSLRAV